MKDVEFKKKEVGGGLRRKKVPLLETINTLQAQGEKQSVGGKSRCAFEWQIRGIASLMHR